MKELIKAAEILNSSDFDLWDIFYEMSENTVISIENQKVEQFTTGFDCGTGIRGVKDYNIYYNFTTEKDKITEIAKNLIKSDNDKKENLLIKKIKAKNKIKVPHKYIKSKKKIEMLKDLDCFIRKIDSKIKQVKLVLSEKAQHVKIINDTGSFIEENRTYTSLIIFIVAFKNSKIETGYSVISGSAGYELFEETDIKKEAKRVAESALKLLDIDKKITGLMPAVISAEAGGTMIHEAVGHSLEADLVQKEVSVFKGKIGEKIANDIITVIEDPTIPLKRGSYNYDDEGVKSKKNILIENGILKSYIHSRITAKRDGVLSTGNGRRESFRHVPIPRMSNIYIAPGKGKAEDLIKDTKKGIFIKKMGGGQVNTVTGDFIFEIKEGFAIENGKITYPVRDATLLGNGPEILKRIDAVCDDLGFESGTCGKDGQGVPVSDAQPTIRVPEILIGSK